MHLLTNYRGRYPMIDSGIGSSNGMRGWPRCACGRRMRINSAASLDRVVPEKGYVRGNVCVVSWRANGIKRDAAPKELMDIALYAGRMAGLR